MTAVGVVIPTYRRDGVLVNSIATLLRCEPSPAEILVIDQSESHEAETGDSLSRWNAEGAIRWVRVPRPSIPAAMNRGLREARSDLILFLDDDIEPSPALIGAHAAVDRTSGPTLAVGQVLQPWDVAPTATSGPEFRFSSTIRQEVEEFLGGNFSLSRDTALALGGFDENFIGAAYRFEAEFAHRFRRSGGRILFEPAASIRHLRAEKGGTRSHGDHLRTARPTHSVGAYYCILRTRGPWRGAPHAAMRLLRSVRTRHHLRHPWWVPATILSELSGLAWAGVLHLRGPRLIAGAGERP